MVNPPEHHVYFAVTDFGDDLDVVTRVMGIPPSKAWVRGEAFGKGKRTHGRWVLQSRLPLSEPVEQHFADLLEQLAGHEEAVREVSRRFSARVSLAAYWKELNPSFELCSDVVQRVAQLGLPIDFDLYCFGPDAAS